MFSAASLGICAFKIPLAIKFIYIAINCSFFLLCAFFKIGEQNFDKYFFYWIKFLFRKKSYLYERYYK